MSRVIKFRGLSAKGQFVYGDLRNDREGTTSYWAEYSQRICWSVGQADHNCPVKNGTIGQFTGLHDKNGVEIYEGDVVNYFIHNYKVGEHNASFGLFSMSHTGFTPFFDSVELRFEVIGNIHENPELLEQSK